jgi:hypothetical protein
MLYQLSYACDAWNISGRGAVMKGSFPVPELAIGLEPMTC